MNWRVLRSSRWPNTLFWCSNAVEDGWPTKMEGRIHGGTAAVFANCLENRLIVYSKRKHKIMTKFDGNGWFISFFAQKIQILKQRYFWSLQAQNKRSTRKINLKYALFHLSNLLLKCDALQSSLSDAIFVRNNFTMNCYWYNFHESKILLFFFLLFWAKLNCIIQIGFGFGIPAKNTARTKNVIYLWEKIVHKVVELFEYAIPILNKSHWNPSGCFFYQFGESNARSILHQITPLNAEMPAQFHCARSCLK